MKHPLQLMMEKRRQGEICGIPSYCSANELVLEQALRRAKELNTQRGSLQGNVLHNGTGA